MWVQPFSENLSLLFKKSYVRQRTPPAWEVYVWFWWHSCVIVESIWQEVDKSANKPTLLPCFCQREVSEDMGPGGDGLG